MDNIVIKGKITATSKRLDGDFKQEVPTKTAYVTTDEENAKKLIEFGATQYTSKEDGENYFILKFPKDVMVYLPNGYGKKRPELSQISIKDPETEHYVETDNFKTPDDKYVLLNVIKGNHKNNDFFRLQAIRVETDEDIQLIQPENPFGDEQAF